MLRDIDLSKVSDGKFYTCNDMVKADCHGCTGCSECCHGMGTSVILDPYDIYQLTTGLSMTFEELLAGPLELSVVDGIILPNLKMCGENEACTFLNSEGRCSIHAIRPGFCRLFPLGRYYENKTFHYFLQIHECPKPNKSKVKIKKWLGIENLKQYEEFTIAWHYFLKEKQEIAMNSDNADIVKKLSMEILRKYYMYPYKKTIDFYTQFEHLSLAQ